MSDVMGHAIYDYHHGKSTEKLWVHDAFGEPVEMKVSYYFRKYNQMPTLEQKALQHCKGKVADIGAGAGSHSLYLQSQDIHVEAYDISSYNCAVMRDRGVKNALNFDIFQLAEARYDTLLLLMNGIGLCQSIERLHLFFDKARHWTTNGGQIIFDSSDVAYMYEDYPMPDHYYGEVRCCYEYKDTFSEWFHWLYVDFPTVKSIATLHGWNCIKIASDDSDQYLAICTKLP